MSKELSKTEQTSLNRCEKIVQEGLSSFVDVGNALAEIRDEQLHRETHERFEDYLQEKWSLSKAYAYRLIAAAEVVETSPVGENIPNESVARELIDVPPSQHKKVLAAAKREEGAVTASGVRGIVSGLQVLGGSKKSPIGDTDKTSRQNGAVLGKTKKPKPTKIEASKPKGPDVPEHLEPVADGAFVRDSVTTLNALVKRIKKESNSLYGPWISDLESIVEGLNHARNQIANLQFGQVCAQCDGKGKKDCCRGTGWIPEWHRLELEAGE